MASASAHYREIQDKRNTLRDRYGSGLISITDMSAELGMDRKEARQWGYDNGILVQLVPGGRVKCDVDALARILVDRRGMV